MPVYDYKCPDHGLFHELGTMEKSGDPCACPQCSKLSARVVMIPPEVLAMAPERRQSIARNEEAAHKPIISSSDSRAEAADKQKFYDKKSDGKIIHCGSGCSHENKSDRSQLKQKAILLPDGSKIFPSQRPWMISH